MQSFDLLASDDCDPDEIIDENCNPCDLYESGSDCDPEDHWIDEDAYCIPDCQPDEDEI